MFGWVIVTGKKILAAVLLMILIHFLSSPLGLSTSASNIVILAFAAGMIFPDLDMVTNFLKQILHSAAIFLFLFTLIVVALYPASIQISGDICSESLTYSIFGISGISTYCNAGTVLIFMGICYIVVRMIVGWFPDGYVLHSYIMALLVTVCAAIFCFFAFDKSIFMPAVVSFAIGYFLHMAIDAGYHHMKN
ncbi:MAG: hypothetical protein WC492_04415 [Candidatus Micrarchaeia archaeon]